MAVARGARRRAAINGFGRIGRLFLRASLERHPDIHQVVVVPIDDALKFKKPVAFVVTRPGAAPSEAAIRQFALANAAPYLHPRRVWFVPEMPLASVKRHVPRPVFGTRFSLPPMTPA